VEYELFEIKKPGKEKELCRGVVDKIGTENSTITHKTVNNRQQYHANISVSDHYNALEHIISVLTDKKLGIINNIDEIDSIGHRVVHGGEKYINSVIITEEVKKEIYRNFELAPLHNPFNLKGIEAAEKLIPGKIQIAVFDTSFHQTLPEIAYRYPLPEKLYTQYRIRKYGFHGISHRYVVERTAYLINKPVEKVNMISIHLGQGSSLCAIKNGISIDTTMGFTPLEGLMMTTRTGDLCPGIILFLQKSGWTLNEIESCLNKQSGVLGVSGISGDMKEVVEQMRLGNNKAKLAIDMFVYSIKKYLGAYYLLLGDNIMAISFTGGIGENSDIIRELICKDISFIGIMIDKNKNKQAINGKEMLINKSNSKIKVCVIPRNEKLIIARDVFNIVSGKK